jgi:hypothetical protein
MPSDSFDADLHGEPDDPAHQTIALELLDRGPRADEARTRLAEALAGTEMSEVDEETGFFDVTIEAADHDSAVQRVIDAIAQAGADDHVVIAEHP